MKNIYLIGMMGSGKTVTGEALAGLKKLKFVDLDAEIEKKTRLSINDIFSAKGERYFRGIEKEMLREVSEKSDTVVATGGGIVLDPENRRIMQRTGQAIYLDASLETLWRRVQDKKDRPLLQVSDPQATLHQLYGERAPLYVAASGGKIVKTDGLTADAVAQSILEHYLK